MNISFSKVIIRISILGFLVGCYVGRPMGDPRNKVEITTRPNEQKSDIKPKSPTHKPTSKAAIEDKDIIDKLKDLKDKVQRGEMQEALFDDFGRYTEKQKKLFCEKFTQDAVSFIANEDHTIEDNFKFLGYSMLIYKAPKAIAERLNNTLVKYNNTQQKFANVAFASLPSQFTNFINLLNKEEGPIEDKEVDDSIKVLEGKANSTITKKLINNLTSFYKTTEGGAEWSKTQIRKGLKIVEASAAAYAIYYFGFIRLLGDTILKHAAKAGYASKIPIVGKYMGMGSSIGKALSLATGGIATAIIMVALTVINRVVQYFCVNPVRKAVDIYIDIKSTDKDKKGTRVFTRDPKVKNKDVFRRSKNPLYIIYNNKKGDKNDYRITNYWAHRLVNLINLEGIERDNIWLCYKGYDGTTKPRSMFNPKSWFTLSDKCEVEDTKDPYCFRLVNVVAGKSYVKEGTTQKQENDPNDPINIAIRREKIRQLITGGLDITEVIPTIFSLIKTMKNVAMGKEFSEKLGSGRFASVFRFGYNRVKKIYSINLEVQGIAIDINKVIDTAGYSSKKAESVDIGYKYNILQRMIIDEAQMGQMGKDYLVKVYGVKFKEDPLQKKVNATIEMEYLDPNKGLFPSQVYDNLVKKDLAINDSSYNKYINAIKDSYINMYEDGILPADRSIYNIYFTDKGKVKHFDLMGFKEGGNLSGWGFLLKEEKKALHDLVMLLNDLFKATSRYINDEGSKYHDQYNTIAKKWLDKIGKMDDNLDFKNMVKEITDAFKINGE